MVSETAKPEKRTRKTTVRTKARHSDPKRQSDTKGIASYRPYGQGTAAEEAKDDRLHATVSVSLKPVNEMDEDNEDLRMSKAGTVAGLQNLSVPTASLIKQSDLFIYVFIEGVGNPVNRTGELNPFTTIVAFWHQTL